MIERLPYQKGKNCEGLFECPYCKKSFKSVIGNIVNGHTKSCGCLRDSSKKQLRNNLVGKRFGRLIVLKRMQNHPINNKVQFLCKCDCGKETIVTSDNLQRGHTLSCGCYKYEQEKECNVKDLSNQKFGKLLVINRVDKSNEKGVFWNCRCDCGKYKIISSVSLLHGTRSCGCIKSKGENLIKEILDKMKILYFSEYSFDNCINPKTNTKLRFDFYLPSYNCCIEYDGIQHFEVSGGWNDNQNLKETQYRDQIKNEYCKNNNIKLIRIPYTDFDILNKSYLIERLDDMMEFNSDIAEG